jgi:NADPH:quinone reductase-like Zn-dependent oxidoreductase
MFHRFPVDSQAAAIPETWLTAFQLLHTIAGVKAGETVLVRCRELSC